MNIKYSEKSAKQLTKIHKGDSKSAEAIIKTIETCAEKQAEKFDIKILKGKLGDFKDFVSAATGLYLKMMG
ncbi:MAG: hypothetical protein HQK92_14160 [Nitrospirae bacterium]|nr:hypothetical protein [Nitrospirota bacterium]